MRANRYGLGLLLLLLTLVSGHAAHTRASLVLSQAAARPGDKVLAGIRLRMDPGWHTYWKNSGASGAPTTVQWTLPSGITAGELMWPVPEKLPEEEFTTYVYSGEVVLLVNLQVAPDAKPGKLDLKAAVSWLECEKQCVPGDAEVGAVLEIGAEPVAANEKPLLETWLKKLPSPAPADFAKAAWGSAQGPDERSLGVEWVSKTPGTNIDFYPFSSESFEVKGPTKVLAEGPGKVRVEKAVRKNSGEWPQIISGLLVSGVGEGREAFEVSLKVPPATGAISPTSSAAGKGSLWQTLLYAFIGGLILNIMPCVLPVIALKILGFVAQSREAPGRIRMLGLVYGAGVLVSFLVLAGMIIAVKAAGKQAGWGMQFGNPQFIVVLIAIVTLVALNLFGLFEVTLSGSLMGAAGSVASKHGATGAFSNGVLATLLATPCTAPFLGAALGFAVGQSAGTIAVIFLTAGFGLAFPYVVLSWQPGWLKFLPKPGPWMEKFKIAMGFPMLATAFWLMSLVPVHYGEKSWWLGLFLVLVAFAAWIFGTFVQHGSGRRLPAAILALAVLGFAYAFLLEKKLDWRKTVVEEVWAAWSPEAVAEAQTSGRPVLVDFTAKWCLTCNTIVKPALESDAVRKKIAEVKAVPLIADYTRLPDNITRELHRFDRAGVPLVVVFPGKASGKPIVLPEAITPGMVVEALEKAAQ